MNDLSLKGVKPALTAVVRKLRPFLGLFIFIIMAGTYGFTVMQISSYSDPAIDDSEVIERVKASPSPRIDETAAAKLQSLKDNSVSVQTLFEEGRENPFQE